MKATIKSVSKGLAIAVVGWIVALVVLIKLIGPIGGFLLASLFAGGGFLLWLLLVHPKLGELATDVIFDGDPAARERAAERAERQEQGRLARDHLDRHRRGNPRDGT